MHPLAAEFAFLILIAAAGPVIAEPVKNPPFFYSQPSELQFGCSLMLNEQEEALASKLEKGPIEERCALLRKEPPSTSG